tara:strand:- start:151 stop:1251 length:1101 start_codon:yes stop_codon:yes gene_type:complete
MTTPVFFYGTLRHMPLLEVVLGRVPASVRPAVLTGHAALAVAEAPLAMLLAQDGGRVQGVAVRDLSVADRAHLDFYAGVFDYALADVVLEDGASAQVYRCAPDRWQGQEPWDIDCWRAEWAAMSCHAATEIMGYFQTRSRAQVAAMLSQIHGRAWSRVLGAQRVAGQGVFEGRIDILRKDTAYAGFFALDEIVLRHQKFDGTMSQPLERSYLIGGDASLVLPYDPVRDRVLLVEQLRVGPMGRGDTEIWHLEPVAGRIDPGETPEAAALREAQEEAGLTLRRLEIVSKSYASPGDSTTYFHIFVGLADLPDTAAGIGGLEAEAENIRSRLVSFDEFIAMAERQAIANTPLALLAYWLAHHRSRLRS